jgi:hypothetical protein
VGAVHLPLPTLLQLFVDAGFALALEKAGIRSPRCWQ